MRISVNLHDIYNSFEIRAECLGNKWGAIEVVAGEAVLFQALESSGERGIAVAEAPVVPRGADGRDSGGNFLMAQTVRWVLTVLALAVADVEMAIASMPQISGNNQSSDSLTAQGVVIVGAGPRREAPKGSSRGSAVGADILMKKLPTHLLTNSMK